jgi:hypothetical protein
MRTARGHGKYPPCRADYMKSKECEYESPGSPACRSSSTPLVLYPGRPSRPHSLDPPPNRQASNGIRAGSAVRKDPGGPVWQDYTARFA